MSAQPRLSPSPLTRTTDVPWHPQRGKPCARVKSNRRWEHRLHNCLTRNRRFRRRRRKASKIMKRNKHNHRECQQGARLAPTQAPDRLCIRPLLASQHLFPLPSDRPCSTALYLLSGNSPPKPCRALLACVRVALIVEIDTKCAPGQALLPPTPPSF